MNLDGSNGARLDCGVCTAVTPPRRTWAPTASSSSALPAARQIPSPFAVSRSRPRTAVSHSQRARSPNCAPWRKRDRPHSARDRHTDRWLRRGGSRFGRRSRGLRRRKLVDSSRSARPSRWSRVTSSVMLTAVWDILECGIDRGGTAVLEAVASRLDGLDREISDPAPELDGAPRDQLAEHGIPDQELASAEIAARTLRRRSRIALPACSWPTGRLRPAMGLSNLSGSIMRILPANPQALSSGSRCLLSSGVDRARRSRSKTARRCRRCASSNWRWARRWSAR